MRALLPALRADLEALARIPSVSLQSLDTFDQAHVDASADAVAALLRAEGLDVEIVHEGGMPAVIGHIEGPPGSPTVTLYAHHDVQPPGDRDLWDSDPWLPTEREGRLYGRGVADDKAGITAHLAALRAHAGNLPVSVTVFVEGEEEVGSESLPTILQRHGERLRADAIVLADSGNWDLGEPALTTTLRGLVRAVVTVETLDHGVHSGMFGGAVPDALTVLVRLLATLHDDKGSVAVSGLRHDVAPALDYSEERLRAESGLLDGVSLIGSGSLLSRLWTQPALTTIGINAPSVENASNTLVPSASAKVSMRLAPEQDPTVAYAALKRHLDQHVAWGARLTVTLADEGRALTRTPVARSTTPRARRSGTPGGSSRSTWALAGRSRSSPRSPSASRTPRFLSPASRTLTAALMGPTSRCTWASGNAHAWPRPSCWPG